jgi:hypothetical protein
MALHGYTLAVTHPMLYSLTQPIYCKSYREKNGIEGERILQCTQFVGKLELHIVSKSTCNISFNLSYFKSHINDLGLKIKRSLKHHEYEIEL